MDAHKLVKMANSIAAFFEAEPDRAVAIEGIAGHLRRFWDPRMRKEILRWVDEHAGEGLTDSVRAAIAAHRDKLASGV
ncbi:MAG TPA: formate dehydrogenase subunit delta [Kofleriaceae bacterium]|nr:formate dehydrogenase subunit delta [Kofleriaceae bacterium]